MPPKSKCAFPSQPSFRFRVAASVTAVLMLEINGEKAIAVGLASGRVEAYDSDTYKHKGTIYAHSHPAAICSLLSSEEGLLVQVRNHGLLFLHPDKGRWKVKRQIPSRHPGICGSCLLSDSLFLPAVDEVTGSVEAISRHETTHSVEVFSLKDGELRARFRFDNPRAMPTCSASDGKRVFVGSDLGFLMVLSQDVKVMEVSWGCCPIFSLAVSGTHVAVGRLESPILVLDKGNLKKKPEETEYSCTAAVVSSICFAPSETTIFAGFWDGAVGGFHAKWKKMFAFRQHHRAVINALRWIDSSRLAVGSVDGDVSFWTFPNE